MKATEIIEEVKHHNHSNWRRWFYLHSAHGDDLASQISLIEKAITPLGFHVMEVVPFVRDNFHVLIQIQLVQVIRR